MIYKPENHYFNWEIPDDVPTEHWQQLIRNIPYEEIIKFLKDNPPIRYTIVKGTEC